ncbi:hypothetical protein [Flavobacterium wongokense]|uniref:hypothetical protein n=1 Tax=Flavobacterium wongokense TaxID=2910674 RepID=UPI001F43A1E5|nr:hypothetical protein [Flavobacterium sp. WG47]MCF6132345.1 hypothetical protein [Flavobacterium sp. WG47]
MKKKVFSLIALVMIVLNVNAQRPSLSMVACDPGQHAVLSFEFNALRFHRASTGCEKKFSICSDGTWTIYCVADSKRKLSSFNSVKNSAIVIGEVSNDGNYVTLHFPIEITKLDGYQSGDFENFGFDSDYDLSKDFTIQKGNYIPTFTEDEILVKVNLK